PTGRNPAIVSGTRTRATPSSDRKPPATTPNQSTAANRRCNSPRAEIRTGNDSASGATTTNACNAHTSPNTNRARSAKSSPAPTTNPANPANNPPSTPTSPTTNDT